MIDAFADALDLAKLGFSGVEPAYHPSVLLKLYIYGYLNLVQKADFNLAIASERSR